MSVLVVTLSLVEERSWQPSWPCALSGGLAGLRRGGGDPTFRVVAGSFWLGIRTPQGTATLCLAQPGGRGSAVLARAWGDGAQWALDGVPALLGDDDDPSGFEPHDELLEGLLRGRRVPRFGRTNRVWEALCPAILEQKVTGQEAFAGYRSLARRFGEPAPGAPASVDLWVQPSPERVATIASWEWLQMHVDRARSAAIVRSARVASSLERIVSLSAVDVAGGVGPEAERRLRSLPGIGEWTAAEVRQRALGDPDAVSFGDYHVAQEVGWAVRGSDMTDEEMRSFLEPWAGHRNRVVSILLAHGRSRPRRGPRMPPRTHLPR